MFQTYLQMLQLLAEIIPKKDFEEPTRMQKLLDHIQMFLKLGLRNRPRDDLKPKLIAKSTQASAIAKLIIFLC